MTEIEWVNHASFIVRSGGTSLVCDPWLFGSAFNDGWELLVPSQHTPADLANVDALWISHVHPDHFAPPVLKAVSKEARRTVRVYFQRTMDQQVAKFCRGIGYPVTEVADGETVEVAPGFKLTVGRVPFYDSWAFLQTPDARILNLNDCVLNRPRDLQRIADKVGAVDVLLTQFSYASWIGGPQDGAQREKAAAEKLDWMRTQLRVIKPAMCIPFASFVMFAHNENQYLNDKRNTVEVAARAIEDAGVTPVVLYPGDTWTVGTAHDSATAMKKYEASWDPGDRLPLSSDVVEWADLEHLATACSKRVTKRNNRLLLRAAAQLGIGAPLVLKLTDLDRTALFDPLHGLTAVDVPDSEVDVWLSSQSFAYTLKFDWGADTLSVNGRFLASPAGYRKMLRTFGPSLLNNNGRALAFRLLADPWLVRRAIDRFLLRAS
jgi:hypothetical protein